MPKEMITSGTQGSMPRVTGNAVDDAAFDGLVGGLNKALDGARRVLNLKVIAAMAEAEVSEQLKPVVKTLARLKRNARPVDDESIEDEWKGYSLNAAMKGAPQ